ncbi:MAG: FAD:protein FMN transferase [Candidatus Moranbacteria bacterium]|nr:FAD:protein FMN transferase [Candidatus Moranbacteria bacterium]
MDNISEKRFKAIGTDIHLEIVSHDEQEASRAMDDINEAQIIYADQEKIFSRFDSESELGFFNVNLGVWHEASPDFIEVSKKVIAYYDLSGGVFDPRIIDVLEGTGYKESFEKKYFKRDDEKIYDATFENNLRDDLAIDGNRIMFKARMDFSGIVKGYITDKISAFLKKKGWKDFIADSGGDIFAAGRNEEGKKWIIGFEDLPEEKMGIFLEGEAVATSGTGRRKWELGGKHFHHLVNPKNPESFSFDLRSVSVVAKSVEEADFWAKYLFILGKEDGMEKAREKEIKAVFLDRRGNAFVTKMIRDNVFQEKGV